MEGQARFHSLSSRVGAAIGIFILGTTLAFAQDDYESRFNLSSAKPPFDSTITSEAQTGPSLTTAAELFADDFNSGILDPGKWRLGANAGNRAGVANNALELRAQGSESGWVITRNAYIARNSTITVKVQQPNNDGDLGISPTYNLSSTFGIYNEANWYRFYAYRTGASGSYRLYVESRKNGVRSGFDVTGSLVINGAVYLRLRLDDARIHFEASLNGATWINTYNETFALPGYTPDNAFYFELAGYRSETNGVLVVDDFSITSSAAQAAVEQIVLNDPLLNNSLGVRKGGQFISGGGWQVTGVEDMMIYDLGRYVENGSLEIEARNFRPAAQNTERRHHFLGMFRTPWGNHHPVENQETVWDLHGGFNYDPGVKLLSWTYDHNEVNTIVSNDWDLTKTYRIKLVWNGALLQYFRDGALYASHTHSAPMQLRYLYLGRDRTVGADIITSFKNNQYPAIVGPIYANLVVKENVAPNDLSPPQIANMATSNSYANAARLSWTTNEPSVCFVEYGVTTAYGQRTPVLGPPAQTFSTAIANLTSNQTYHYRIVALDDAGNLTTSANQAFTTLQNSVYLFKPAADTYVEQAGLYGTTRDRGNFGWMNLLGGAGRECYLRFNVAGLNDNAVQASLRLHGRQSGNSGGALRVLNASWDENNVTWLSKPSVTGQSLGTINSVQAGQWHEVNVASAVAGAGTYDFALVGSGANVVSFDSRESTNSQPELIVTTGAGGEPTLTATVLLYKPFEVRLSTTTNYSNPYHDASLIGVFTSPAGREMRLKGFWNGGRNWVVRFSPTEAGIWSYRTESSDGSLVTSGTFEAQPNPAKRGFVRASPSRRYQFEYSDGTPFLLMGETNWDAMGSGVGFEARFKSFVNVRVAQNFNAFNTMIVQNRYDYQSNEGGAPFEMFNPDTRNFDRLNPGFFQWVDRRVAYADSMGMVSILFFTWAEELRRMPTDAYKRLALYIVSRYAAYNVFWVLAGDYTVYFYDPPLYREVGNAVAAADPYDHPISIHPGDGRSNREFGNDAWLGYVMYQHRDAGEFLADSIRVARIFNKPVVNAEYGYHFPNHVHAHGILHDAHYTRTGGWMIFNAGGFFVSGFQHTYYDPDEHYDDDLDNRWDLNDPPDLEAGRQHTVFYRFFRDHTSWWELDPHPELARPGGPLDGQTELLAKPGSEYVAYNVRGGRMRLQLPANQHFSLAWFDPIAGALQPGRVFQSTGEAVLLMPSNNLDGAALLRAAAAPSVTAAGNVTNLQSQQLNIRQARFTWQTPEPSDSRLDLQKPDGSHVQYLDNRETTQHEIIVDGLSPDINYTATVASQTADGREWKSSPRGLRTMVVVMDEWIEAENMPTKTVGHAEPPGWNLDTNGHLAISLNFPQTGPYRLVMRSRSEHRDGWPNLSLQLDNNTLANLSINSAVFKEFSVDKDVTAGTHQIKIAFTNDLDDRALIVDWLHVQFIGATETQPPLISNVTATNITSSSARIAWNTDEPADSQVEYGLDTNYGSFSALDPSRVTSHAITLAGLAGNTTYHYRVNSKDAAGNLAVSDDFTFTTLPDVTPPVISNVNAGNITTSAATINWSTDEASDSQIEYGLDTNYGSVSTLDATRVISHTTVISGLTANTTYHYRVKSKDASGNLAVSGNFTFATASPAPAFEVTLEAENMPVKTGGGERPPGWALWSNGYLAQTVNFPRSDSYRFTLRAYGSMAVGEWSKAEIRIDQVSKAVITVNTSTYAEFTATFSVNAGSHEVAIAFINDLFSPPDDRNLYVDWLKIQSGPSDTQPPVISNVAASNLTTSAATITWTTNEASDRQVEYGLDTNYGSSSPLDAALLISHSVTLSNLQANTTYHYRVKSKDAAGNLAVSGNFTFTTPVPDLTPPVISSVNAGNITTSAATITWSTDEASDSQVEYGLDTNYGSASALDATRATSHTINLSGLANNTTYHYRVKSKDAAGNLAVSDDFTFTTLPDVTPPVISNVNASNITTTTATINWSTDEASDSQVEYGLDANYGSVSTLDVTRAISHTTAISGLTAGTTYHFRVKSKDAAGNLAVSGNFTFTTSSLAPAFEVTLEAENMPTKTVGGERPPGWGLWNNGYLAQTVNFPRSDSYRFTLRASGSIAAGDWSKAELRINQVAPQGGVITVNTSTYAEFTATFSVNAGSHEVAIAFINDLFSPPDDRNLYVDWLKIQSGPSDTQPPVISNVAAGNITTSAATITWTTNEASDRQVEYGLDTNYGSASALDAALLISHSVTLSNLQANTTYHYRVKSKDAAGNLTVSGNFTFTTLPDVTPPVISNVNASNITTTTATINWSTDEASDSQVEYGLDTNYGSVSTLDATRVISHTTVISGLTAGTIYHYRVKSKDAAGNLAVSGNFTFTTAPPAPAFEVTLEAENMPFKSGGGSRPPGWALWSNGHLAQTVNFPRSDSYRFILRAYGSFAAGAWSKAELRINQVAPQGGVVTVNTSTYAEFTVTFSVNAGSHEMAIAFINDLFSPPDDRNLYVDWLKIQFGPSDTQPPVISNVAAGNLTTSAATITWTTNEASDRQVEYGLTTNYGSSSPLDAALLISHSVTLSNLQPNTTYHYRVKSKDAAGNLAVSGNFTFTTLPDLTPPVISNVNASNITTTTATINWSTDEVSDSQVEYGLDANYGSASALDANRVISHSATISGLTANTTYHYRVKSRDAAGNLAVSGNFSFTTAPPAPAFEVTLEAENMPFKSGGGSRPPGWALWSNGHLAQTVNFPSSGSYRFTLRAYGSIAAGDWSKAELRINQVASPGGVITVNTSTYAEFTATFSVNAGSQEVAIAFINDLYSPPDDRNLYVDWLRIQSAGAATAAAVSDAADGKVAPLSAAKEFIRQDETIPSQLALQTYPNPLRASGFNAATRVRLALPQRVEIELHVFDIAGRSVHDWPVGSYAAGYHELIWNGRTREGLDLSSGIYFLRLRYRPENTGAWSHVVRRLLIVK